MTKEQKKIYEIICASGPISGSTIALQLNITRQAVHKHIKKLIEHKKIVKKGQTKNALFFSSSSRNKQTFYSTNSYKKRFSLKNLEEQKVFDLLSLKLNLTHVLFKNAYSVFEFAFTEILNNAIDHSKSQSVFIDIEIFDYDILFKIQDLGIGIFHNIASKFHLSDEYEALEELLKGKATTMPNRHSGEGLFFTLRSGKYISIVSHKIKMEKDNKTDSLITEDVSFKKGTEVVFQISKRQKKKLRDIFNEYAPEEYNFSFSKTEVRISLNHKKYVSRSEAKRLLFRLDKFKEIVLDFSGVSRIEQGFADEIFRVFQNHHTDKKIKIENTSPAVKAMINHVVDKKNISLVDN